MLHFYVDSPAPSLHGNNSEIGAKTVNIKMSRPFIGCIGWLSNKVQQTPRYYTNKLFPATDNGEI